VLDPDYKDGIRFAFQEAFPPRKRARDAKPKAAPASAAVLPRQPGLFDRVG